MEFSESEPNVEGEEDRLRKWQIGHRLIRRALGCVLVLYWLCMFLGTHIDIGSPGPEVPYEDKIVHIVCFSVLGALLSLWVATKRPLSWNVVIGVMATIALYGAFDELTQLLVDRECDVMDWLADMFGASLGVSVVTLLSHRVTGRKGSAP